MDKEGIGKEVLYLQVVRSWVWSSSETDDYMSSQCLASQDALIFLTGSGIFAAAFEP